MSIDVNAARVFLSYRREDSAAYAGRLYDSLTAQLGGWSVFMDIDSIHPGRDFVEVIGDELNGCEAVIVLIGPRWLTVVDGAGLRRLDSPRDLHRLEIEGALARSIQLVPVLVGGAIMPSVMELPPSLQPLTRKQALELSDRRWHADVAELAAVLRPPPALSVTAPPPPPVPVVASPPPPLPSDAASLYRPLPAPSAQLVTAASIGRRRRSSFALAAASTVVLLLAVVLTLAVISRGSGAKPASTSVPASPSTTASTTTSTTPFPSRSASPQVVISNGPWTVTAGGVTLTVDRVERGAVARVAIEVANGTADTLELPAGEFFVIDENGKSYSVDPFSSGWKGSVPSGARVTGAIDLQEPISLGSHVLQAGFSHVFGSFSVSAIKVTGIGLS